MTDITEKKRRDNPLRRKAAAKLKAGESRSLPHCPFVWVYLVPTDAQTRLGCRQRRSNGCKCQTSTCRPTLFCSSKTCPRELRPTTCAKSSRCKSKRGRTRWSGLTTRYAGLLEIRTIPAKKDIAFVEFADEATATVAKDALHNFKIDGETKMKVRGGFFWSDITSPASLTCRSRMRESSSGPRIAGMRTVRPALQPRRYVYKHELPIALGDIHPFCTIALMLHSTLSLE